MGHSWLDYVDLAGRELLAPLGLVSTRAAKNDEAALLFWEATAFVWSWVFLLLVKSKRFARLQVLQQVAVAREVLCLRAMEVTWLCHHLLKRGVATLRVTLQSALGNRDEVFTIALLLLAFLPRRLGVVLCF